MNDELIGFIAKFTLHYVYGYNLINSDNKRVDTIDIAMLHIAEDFRMKFVPTPQDYLKHLEVQTWFCNGVKDLGCAEATKRADEIKEKLSEENLVE